jgi:hypothetical protein
MYREAEIENFSAMYLAEIENFCVSPLTILTF